MSSYHCYFDLFSRVIKQVTSHSRGRRPHAWRWHSHWRSSTRRHSHWWTHWGPHARRRAHHTCREDRQTAHNKSHNRIFSKEDWMSTEMQLVIVQGLTWGWSSSAHWRRGSSPRWILSGSAGNASSCCRCCNCSSALRRHNLKTNELRYRYLNTHTHKKLCRADLLSWLPAAMVRRHL